MIVRPCSLTCESLNGIPCEDTVVGMNKHYSCRNASDFYSPHIQRHHSLIPFGCFEISCQPQVMMYLSQPFMSKVPLPYCMPWSAVQLLTLSAGAMSSDV